jgi:hypothetical protein
MESSPPNVIFQRDLSKDGKFLVSSMYNALTQLMFQSINITIISFGS